MALGARSAKVTNRADSAKDFVRHGAAKATISITLANVGPHAYCHPEFGNELTVTRILPGTTFTLAGLKCKAVKSNAKEIERVMQAGCQGWVCVLFSPTPLRFASA